MKIDPEAIAVGYLQESGNYSQAYRSLIVVHHAVRDASGFSRRMTDDLHALFSQILPSNPEALAEYIAKALTEQRYDDAAHAWVRRALPGEPNGSFDNSGNPCEVLRCNRAEYRRMVIPGQFVSFCAPCMIEYINAYNAGSAGPWRRNHLPNQQQPAHS